MKALQAIEAAATEEDGTLTVALGNLDAKPPWHILLSRALEPNRQDIRLGMTGLWMEVNDRFHSGYDAVTIEEVRSAAVALRVNAARLGLDADWGDIRIALPEGNLRAVRAALDRLKRGGAEG